LSLQGQIEEEIPVPKENAQRRLCYREIEHTAFPTCSALVRTSEGPRMLENDGTSSKYSTCFPNYSKAVVPVLGCSFASCFGKQESVANTSHLPESILNGAGTNCKNEDKTGT